MKMTAALSYLPATSDHASYPQTAGRNGEVIPTSKRAISINLSIFLALAACGGSKTGNESAADSSDNSQASAEATHPALSCPNQFDIPVAAAGVPQDSVGGLRLGTLLDQATLFIRCQDKTIPYTIVDDGGGFRLDNSVGENIRQITRVTNGKPLPMGGMEEYHRRQQMNGPGDDFDKVTDDFHLLALGRKGGERLEGIWHKQVYVEGKMPPAAAAGRALVSKYGPPSHLRETSSGAELVWMYDTYGRKMTDQTPGFENCVSNVPAAYGHMSATAECGLTVAAFVAKSEKNELLAKSLDVGVMNPSKLSADLDALNRQFKGEDATRKQRELNAAGANKSDVKL